MLMNVTPLIDVKMAACVPTALAPIPAIVLELAMRVRTVMQVRTYTQFTHTHFY